MLEIFLKIEIISRIFSDRSAAKEETNYKKHKYMEAKQYTSE